MVAETNEDQSIKIPIPVLGGSLVARGTAVFIILAVMGTGWAIFEKQKDLMDTINKQNLDRAAEHIELQRDITYNSCLNRLAIYMSRTPSERPVDFYHMPTDLYNCAPKFLSDMPKKE